MSVVTCSPLSPHLRGMTNTNDTNTSNTNTKNTSQVTTPKLLHTTCTISSSTSTEIPKSIPASASTPTSTSTSNSTCSSIPRALLADVANIAYIECNGETVSRHLTAREFLKAYPRGAYTTMRTVNRASIFRLEAQIQRLAESTDLIIQRQVNEHQVSIDTTPSSSPSSVAPLSTHISDTTSPSPSTSTTTSSSLTSSTPFTCTAPETLRPMLIRLIQHAITSFDISTHNTLTPYELKIIVLLSWPTQMHPSIPLDCYIHLSLLPPPPPSPIHVVIRYAHRENAIAKDSEWVHHAERMEKEKPVQCNEVLMCSENGELLEGCSSNAFVIYNGTLHTADDGVLKGTVRATILEQCRAHNIPISFEPPNVRDIKQWSGMIISSTSRLALPVDTVTLHDGVAVTGGARHVIFDYTSPDHPVMRLRTWVNEAIQRESTRILSAL